MYSQITDEKILEQLNGDKNLSNADLRNADISAVTVNLENVRFENANLEGANLSDVNLYDAILHGANFTGANLEDANLEEAKINGANFTGANLKNTKFENIKDFRGTHFNGARCNDISFKSSELKGGDFTDVHFENTEFFFINFKGANLNGAYFGYCFFQECDFSEADLRGANFTGSNFEVADIIGAHLENANFSNATFKNVIFDNSFLEGAIFQGVTKDENTQFDTDNLSKVQREQLGISTKISLIYKLNNPNPDIPSLIELIRSDEWDTEEVDKYGKTALMIVCSKPDLNEVALELIKTGKSKPGYLNDENGDTALMIACMAGMEDIALAIIDTKESDIYSMNDNGDNAFKFATEKNLSKVLAAFPKNIIDITQTGFDTINQEDIVISDYLKKNPYNLVVMINNSYYFTSKDAIKKQIMDTANIKYGCKEAGEQSRHIMDENIIYDISYFSLSSLFGLQILIRVEDAKKMMDILSGNMFILRKSIKLPAIISLSFIDGGQGISADHCQSGKATDTYIVFSASPDCGIKLEASEAVEETKDELSGMSNKIMISYKEGKYPISINGSTTVDELKELFLNDLMSKGIIDNKNFNVRFIFKGKILKDDLPIEIKENPVDFTIQAMVNPVSGGRKTMKKRKNTKKKTMKQRKTTKKRKIMKKRKTMKKRK
jgi:uncharacterized protein YjbI with pentapeptide repeats